MEQHLDTAAIQEAEDRFDDLVTEAEEITGLHGKSGVEHTGGGCLALTIETRAGIVVATVALDTGYTDYPAWGTEPDVPATEDGPWFVSFFPGDTWHDGPVEAATDDRVPLDRAGLLGYVRDHLTPDRDRTEKLAAEIRAWLAEEDGTHAFDDLQPDGNASPGFRDSCDDYQGFAFTVERDGRRYYVTVEDVTISE